MDYEKAYKKAVEKLRYKISDNDGNIDYNEVVNVDELQDIFPELQESEDEKNIKDLIDELKCSLRAANCQNDACNGGHEKRIALLEWAIAWLEKQGTPSMLSQEEQNEFVKGVLTSCALSFINYLDAHKHEGKMCVSNGECEDIENAFHNAMWDRLHRYYRKYIEKQGENSPVLSNSLNIGKREISGNEGKISPKWSKEDEEEFKIAIETLHEAGQHSSAMWLKSIKQRIVQ